MNKLKLASLETMVVLACKHRYLQGKLSRSHIIGSVLWLIILFLVLNRNTTSSAIVTFLVHLSKVSFHSIAYLTALLDKKNNCKSEIALKDAS